MKSIYATVRRWRLTSLLIFNVRTLALQASNVLAATPGGGSLSDVLDQWFIPRPGVRISPDEMDAIRARHPGYADIDLFIETGTLEAANVVNLSSAFSECHSIDLSPPLYNAAVKRFGPSTRFGIHFHLGDSAVVLPKLLSTTRKPAVIYLDGHFCMDHTGLTAATEFPLWTELAAIAQRPYGDIVIVDDVHTFGTSRPDLEVKESGRGWQHVSIDTILDGLGRDRVVDHFIQRDCFIVYLAPRQEPTEPKTQPKA